MYMYIIVHVVEQEDTPIKKVHTYTCTHVHVYTFCASCTKWLNINNFNLLFNEQMPVLAVPIELFIRTSCSVIYKV